MIIAVDFDGTCVTHAFPEVGKDIGAIPVLKALVAKGHRLILYTMRDDRKYKDHYPLNEAIQWFTKNGIELYCFNSNPTQGTWSKSPKVFAHLYIDDAALGIPLKFDEQVSERPFVDWGKVEQLLKEKEII